MGHVRPCVRPSVCASVRPCAPNRTTDSKTLDQILLKPGMIMDLPTGHMHVNWLFDPIQDDRQAAIFDVKTGTFGL